MANKISFYLEQIKLSNPINVQEFKKFLPAEVAELIDIDCSKTLIGNGKHLVIIDCTDLLKTLEELAYDGKDRTEASLKGNSHRNKVSKSFFLVWHNASKELPSVVCSSLNSFQSDFFIKKNAVIIENQELFFTEKSIYHHINTIFGTNFSFEETDLIYGSGNEITNSLNHSFLNKYEKIFCFFDYDLGGLKIFKTLKENLRNNVLFLQPVINIEGVFKKTPKDASQFKRTLDNAQLLHLDIIHEYMSSTLKFMEQEAILSLKMDN